MDTIIKSFFPQCNFWIFFSRKLLWSIKQYYISWSFLSLCVCYFTYFSWPCIYDWYLKSVNSSCIWCPRILLWTSPMEFLIYYSWCTYLFIFLLSLVMDYLDIAGTLLVTAFDLVIVKIWPLNFFNQEFISWNSLSIFQRNF